MKLPLLSGREVLAALRRMGFIEVHRKGSHVKMKHSDGRNWFRVEIAAANNAIAECVDKIGRTIFPRDFEIRFKEPAT